MPTRDYYTMLRCTSDGALSADANLSAFSYSSDAPIELEGTPISGLALAVNVPDGYPTGTSPTLTVIVRASTSTTAPTTATTMIAGQAVITAEGNHVIPFVDPDVRSILVDLDVSGSVPNFGAVEVGIIRNLGQGWSRAVSFH